MSASSISGATAPPNSSRALSARLSIPRANLRPLHSRHTIANKPTVTWIQAPRCRH